MSFIYYCMHCSQKIDVDDSLENKAAVCPTCNKSIFLMKTPQCGTAAENTPAPQNCPQVQLLHQQMQTVPQQNVQQIVCEIPSGGGRAYKIFHEPLKVCLAHGGMRNLEDKLNVFAGQNWRVISSVVVGNYPNGEMVFVLERDNN